MATPNYGNQMGQAPGMPMQQQMGQGAVPPPRPVRRGTSKAVPVVMSAGLAVGVFCGLLFGLGTGNEGALAATDTRPNLANAYGSADLPDVLKTPTAADGTAKSVSATPLAPVPAPAPAPAVAATGSAAAAPAVAPAKLKIEISPDSAQAAAKIAVDGKDFTPDMAIALDSSGKKTVDVTVQATGFHDFDQKVEVLPGDTIVKVELAKRAVQAPSTPAVSHNNSGGNSGNNSQRPTWTGTQAVPVAPKVTPPPKGNGTKGKQPPKGGLIDI